MAATFKYDSVVSRQVAVNSQPDLLLNYQRESMRFATASGTLQPDASYPTGGYPASPAKFGLTSVSGVFIEDANGYAFYYNKSTDKIQAFSASGTEVANATNLSTLPAVYFEAKGLA